MTFTLIETINTYTPLGIRFWDPLLDQQVRDSLKVTARAEYATGPTVVAFRTASDVYAFQGLPGMQSVENRALKNGENNSTPQRRSFIVEIRDARERFVDIGMRMELPLEYRGVYLSSPPSSPSGVSPKGLHLFSAVTRKVPGITAVVRGELQEAFTDRPAANALIRVESEDGSSRYGLANKAGRFVVLMPYPTFTSGMGSSSTSPVTAMRITEQTWNINVQVFYEPASQQDLAGSQLKNYETVLSQSAATIWESVPDNGGGLTDVLSSELHFGKETILASLGSQERKLLINPA